MLFFIVFLSKTARYHLFVLQIICYVSVFLINVKIVCTCKHAILTKQRNCEIFELLQKYKNNQNSKFKMTYM